jgi:RHS repeat-associated protein
MYSFSGKERDEESNYSYFGARYYNSDISLWLSVDPRASSYPSLTPYNYCMNSPVMLRDPNGEFVLSAAAVFGIIAAGLIGTYQCINIAIDHNVSGVARLGYGLAGGLIGSVSAFAGASVGVGIGAALGTNSFIGGFISGYASAATATTLSVSSMAWLGGASFGEGLATGLIQGQISGGISGLMGGLGGGIGAAKHGGNFWTGEGATYEYTVKGDPISSDELFAKMANNYNNSEAACKDERIARFRISEYFVVPKEVSDITTNTGNYGLTNKGYYYNFKKKGLVAAFVSYKGLNQISVHISPYVVNDAGVTEFKAIVGHEFIHAIHYGMFGKISINFSESVAYQYSANIFLSGDDIINYNHAMRQYYSYGGYAPFTYYYFIPFLR